MTPLTASQAAAVEHVRSRAHRGRDTAVDRLRAAGAASSSRLIQAVRRHGRVTLNFHPDRLLVDGRTTVAAAISADGRYRSQFETGVSNGSRTAYAGGARDAWEEAMFGGAYHLSGVAPVERPKYGALNLMNHSDGAAPRFGSCHVRLRPAVLERCTFCHGDSHVGPADVGTIDAFEHVLAGLLEGAEASRFMTHLQGLHRGPVGANASAAPGRSLDDYVEAQVHGDIDLATDAEAIVLDPSFRGTPSALLLTGTAERCGIAVEWHAGFQLAAEAVPADFRGPVMPPLAAWICDEYAGLPGRPLDAEVLGRAAASVVTRPDAWAEWGSTDDALQYIKQLWHVLVRFGSPCPDSASVRPSDVSNRA